MVIRYERGCKSNLKREIKKRGLDPKRIFFAKKLPTAEHLKRIQNADLFLDTFNYNAHTTGSDALWSGIPLLTLIGKSFPARVGASLVTAAGLPELICKSREEYFQKACAFYNDQNSIKKIKKKLGIRNRKLLLFNSKNFVDELEEHFVKILS